MYHYTSFPARNYVWDTTKKKKQVENVFTLDTETSSLFYNTDTDNIHGYDKSLDAEYYKKCLKFGICYIWMMSVDGDVYYGRNLEELPCFLTTLSKAVKGKEIFIYVHNFGFDFEFLSNVISFQNVFARKCHKPFKAYDAEHNITFRDSYVLSMSSLEGLTENYNLNISKKSGDLDYLKVRGPETFLTDDELGYCENDCLVLHEYITKKKQEVGSIKGIAMTQTGEVRRALKDKIKETYNGGMIGWEKFVSSMHPNITVFRKLVEAYSGGYTHANAGYVGTVLKNIGSDDFTSSYPYVLLSEKYPMTKFSRVNEPMSSWDFDNYAYIIEARFTDMESSSYHDFISFNKCRNVNNPTLDNGRVYRADSLEITMNEQDFLTFRDSYNWENMEIISLYRARKGYLPKVFTEFISELFEFKQTFKGVEGKEDFYVICKQRLNGCYGMIVTNTISDIIEWREDDWKTTTLTDQSIEQQLNDQYGHEFLPYQWGVWVAAYARRNLLSCILEVEDKHGDCVIYCDTDSMKSNKDISDIIDEYNAKVRNKMKAYCERVGRDYETVKGLGEFDHDANYDEFITLGAKKYAYKETKKNKKTGVFEQHTGITVSGVGKSGVEALNNDIANFKDGLLFNDDCSGRQIQYYNYEQPYEIKFTDYLGNQCIVKGQRHGICLQPSSYTMGLTVQFKEFCGARQCL